ncbi:gliding motility-associated C-terminal domain-containing protein, partial [Crocinitomix catalasitica]|nr:gliding motility-associated C-terminal domain-containing protein [Crocinitomix catalasitica]
NIEILDFVLDWYENPESNYGMMLKIETESVYRSMKFSSSDYSDSILRPKLVIHIDGESSSTSTVENSGIIIPTGITPNNDGVNDLWELDQLNQSYPNNTVRIYNRWGNIIFESNGYSTPWDGLHKGRELPTASYFFSIQYGSADIKSDTGIVTIIRDN